MLPSRGLRSAHFAHSASRQSLQLRSNASWKFSSVPRRAVLTGRPSQASPLQSAKWRPSATSPLNTLLTPSTVRYGSWYAPWSWGRSSTPSDASPSPPSELKAEAASAPESVITTATPELAPAGIDKAPIVENASAANDPRTVEELLGIDPTASAPVAEIDPTAPLTHVGQLKELGLDYGWGSSATYEWLIENMYLMSDWGWAGCIVGSAIVLRTVLFPLQCISSNGMAKLAALKPVIQPIQDKMEDAKRRGDERAAQVYKMEQQQVMKSVQGTVFTTPLVAVAQMAIGFGAFRCLRGMSSLPVPGLSADGFLWFHDLTVSDPYFILPLATGGLMYILMKTGGETGVNTQAAVTDMQKKIQVILPLVFTTITVWQPAALQLYFLCTSLLGAGSGWILRRNAFRRLVGMQPLPSKESNELFSKVVKGEVKLESLPRDAAGKIRYQAPQPSSTISATARTKASPTPNAAVHNRGINIKAGTAIPPHLRQTVPKVEERHKDRDADYETGPQGGVGERVDWMKRNYRPTYVWRRMVSWANSGKSLSMLAEEAKREKAKRRVEEYEYERKRRFENRR